MDIKDASNYAFLIELFDAKQFNCEQGSSSTERIENALNIIYYVYNDRMEYEL